MTQRAKIGLGLLIVASTIAIVWLRSEFGSDANAHRTDPAQTESATGSQLQGKAKDGSTTVSAMPMRSNEAVDPILSGLQIGETSTAFNVLDVSGPRAGKKLCYACAFAMQPVICIQARKLSNELIQLVHELESLVDPADSITSESKHAFVVYITDDSRSATQELTTIASDQQLQRIPLTICDDIIGPHGYRIAEDAEVTVMIWSNNIVSFNAAVGEGGCDSAFVTGVLEQARKHLGQTNEVSSQLSGALTTNQATTVSLDSLRTQLAQHKNKIVVVDLWALWCSHCIAALPHLDALQEQYPQDVHTIALNVDFENESDSDWAVLRQRVNAKLETLGIGSERMICSDARTQVFKELGIYSLPATIVFDQNGEMLKTFEGTVDYETQIVPLIEKQSTATQKGK